MAQKKSIKVIRRCGIRGRELVTTKTTSTSAVKRTGPWGGEVRGHLGQRLSGS